MEEEVCRLCLQINPTIKIFHGNVVEKIQTFCNIKLDIADKLPKHICEICSQAINNVIEFKTKCEINDKILQNKVNCGTKFEVKWESDSDFDDLLTFDDVPVTKNEILSDSENVIQEKEIKSQIRKIKLKKDSNSDIANKCISKIEKNDFKNVIKYETPISYSPKERNLRKSYKKQKLKNGRFIFKKDINFRDNCAFCGEFFKSKDLPRHILIHNPRPFQCNLCQRTFKYKCKLIPHLKTHEIKQEEDRKEPLIECKLCGKAIPEFYLKHHLPDNRDNKNYQCFICNQGFVSKMCYTHHVKRHGPQPKQIIKKLPKVFQCHICGSIQKTTYRLNCHISRVHLKNDFFQCKICGRTMRMHAKQYHMTHAHIFEKKFECDICKQRFISKERIREHVKTHLSLKPFECNICGGTFTRNNTLKRHIIRHENRFQKAFEIEINS